VDNSCADHEPPDVSADPKVRPLLFRMAALKSYNIGTSIDKLVAVLVSSKEEGGAEKVRD